MINNVRLLHAALSLAILEALNGRHLFEEKTRTAIPQMGDGQTITLYQLIDERLRRERGN